MFETAVRRASLLQCDTAAWQALVQRGMAQDLSLHGPALAYLALFAQACQTRAVAPRGAAM